MTSDGIQPAITNGWGARHVYVEPVAIAGARSIYKGGVLPDWANVNAPKFLPYVIATPGLAVGYSPRMFGKSRFQADGLADGTY